MHGCTPRACSNFIGRRNKKILNESEQRIPFTSWGRIDWERMKEKIEVEDVEEIIQVCKKKVTNLNTSVFVLWDEGTLPVIKSDLIQCKAVIDDVLAVSFDTWFWSPNQGYVIEFYHEGEITIGFA